MRSYFAVCFALVALSIPIFTSAATYDIDPAHSSFSFKVRHLTVSNVTGTFGKVKGIAVIDDRDITNLRVEVTLDAFSIDTSDAKRDEHLRSPDFFDVAKYPFLTFVSKKISRIDTTKIQVTGDLTIRGVTKEVTVDMEGPTPEIKDPGGKMRRGATGTTKINRKDFGIAWNRTLDTGGLVVGDEVNISVEVELIKN
ncbi:MAG: protein yceI precursor [Deltaproteobacteria bacterium]|jgi:polyisoprenoid-binding protein YceI|nr:protein yceI precursor [Deltaproteobacteria bacterium]